MNGARNTALSDFIKLALENQCFKSQEHTSAGRIFASSRPSPSSRTCTYGELLKPLERSRYIRV
jgi:hypothetical protein